MDLVKLMKKTFTNFAKSIPKSKISRNNFILYKIVESYLVEAEERYKVQCINTKALLELTLKEIVFDLDILYGLHPIQGCFIGIEYAKVIKAKVSNLRNNEISQAMLNKYSVYRYGSNNLLYQSRQGCLGFICDKSGEEFLMDPRDIALSRELIEEFDVAQAFCIGVLAGLKLVNSAISQNHTSNNSFHLKLVKG